MANVLGMKYRVHAVFVEPMLGTVALDEDTFRRVAAPEVEAENVTEEAIDEEVGTLPSEERGWTGFHIDDEGYPFVYDYLPKGFFKAACGALRRVTGGTASSELKAYKKVIDTLILVRPRRIRLEVPGFDPATGEGMGELMRPLRVPTPKGERVAIARSKTVPAGTTMEFEVLVLGDVVTRELLQEWLDYACVNGLGQWRNASYGQVICDIVEESAVSLNEIAMLQRARLEHGAM